MTMNRVRSIFMVAVIGLALVMATPLIGHRVVQGDGLNDLEGKVEIDGSSTVAPITIKAANRFADECPKVHIPVAVSGTGGGFKRFTRGDTDISNASRPIRNSELEQCRLNGVKFVELPIAYDGLTIVVNLDSNWIDCLTLDELRKIFGNEAPALRWSDVRADWPSVEIKIYAPGTDSGTFDYFKDVVAGNGALRDDMSVSEDDNQLVTAVAKTKGAIGFFGAAYFFANTDKLRCVPIVNPESGEPVSPNAISIANGSYAPFSRPLFVYVNARSARRPEVRLFINLYLQHATELAESVGYVGLPSDIYAAARHTFNNRPRPLTGTHFVRSEGKWHQASLTELYVQDNLVE